MCRLFFVQKGYTFYYFVQGEMQTTDLGQLLMGFFRRFGSHFNLYTDAVAIGSGGICPKKDVCQFEEDVLAPKLCVQDISTLRYSLVHLCCQMPGVQQGVGRCLHCSLRDIVILFMSQTIRMFVSISVLMASKFLFDIMTGLPFDLSWFPGVDSHEPCLLAPPESQETKGMRKIVSPVLFSNHVSLKHLLQMFALHANFLQATQLHARLSCIRLL